MSEIRELARLGRAARERAGINVRKPLGEVVCVAGDGVGRRQDGSPDPIEALVPLLARELNVKRVTFAASSDDLVTLTAKPNFRGLGKIFGKHTNEAAGAVRALSSEQLLSLERGAEIHITAGGETHPVTLDALTIERRAAGTFVVEQDGQRFAAIDPTITEELRDEGIARELVSRVQRLRKDMGFAVSDRVDLGITGDALIESAARAHESWIAGEVLATRVRIGAGEVAAEVPEVDLDAMKVRLSLTRMA
jgi:isoleucyl-tRNA synthetase